VTCLIKGLKESKFLFFFFFVFFFFFFGVVKGDGKYKTCLKEDLMRQGLTVDVGDE
jgi:hypothetical protein